MRIAAAAALGPRTALGERMAAGAMRARGRRGPWAIFEIPACGTTGRGGAQSVRTGSSSGAAHEIWETGAARRARRLKIFRMGFDQ
jgi:hypothetical protein